MEEPDMDELEWMAASGFPDEFEDDMPEDPGPPSPRDDNMRKRLWLEQKNGAQPKGSSQQGDVVRVTPKQHHPAPLPPTSVPPATNPNTDKSGPEHASHATAAPTSNKTHSRPEVEHTAPPPEPSAGGPSSGHQPTEAGPSTRNELNEAGPSTSYEPARPRRSKKPSKMAADIAGECLSVTGLHGERVYVEVQTGLRQPQRTARVFEQKRDAAAGSLLSLPIERLIEEVEGMRLQRILDESERSSKAEDDETSQGDHVTRKEIEEQLWVEKYAPSSFTELLSDEHNNRELLRWLKQWDPCVFGTKSTVREETPVQHTAGRGSGSGWKSNDKGVPFGMPSTSGLIGEMDDKKPVQGDRPEEKIILLCGPPGAGKTTLAHVAARHCGYRVVEVNASDDRAAAALKSRILDAVQMKPVMGDKRPNCLVIDEIDGVLNGSEGKSAISALLEIVQAGSKGTERTDDSAPKGKGKKKKGGVKKLTRPIICICNDLYAPALRPLRQIARVITFTQPTASCLSTRLKAVCRWEKFRADSRALTALCEHTECDIRSCLNTLQFLRRRGRSLQAGDVASQVIGRKDITRSMFDVWQEVFQKRKARSHVSSNAKSSDTQEFHRVADLVAGYGDYDFIMDGIHENVLKMRYHDSALDKTVECLRWMADSEIMNRRTISRQQHFLMAYQPCTVLAVRRLVASIERPYIEFPRAYAKFRSERSLRAGLLQSWLADMAPPLARALQAQACVLDVVSPLLTVLVPSTLRPVAVQLLSAPEKSELAELLDTMLNFGLSYTTKHTGLSFSERLASMAMGPQLEPPINLLATFQDKVPQRRQLSITLRQLLAHELELEAIRREGAARAARNGGLAAPPGSTPKAPPTTPTPRATAPSATPMPGPATSCGTPRPGGSPGLAKAPPESNPSESDLNLKRKASDSPGKDKPKKKPVAVKAPVDFFGRFKNLSQKRTTTDATSVGGYVPARDAYSVLYKFHEGFTNAVRRPVLMKDLVGPARQS